MSDDVTEYRSLDFMRSRIPAQDALEAFIPAGEQPDDEMRELMGRAGFSRWYPVDGGHRMRTLYEGGPFDSTRYSLIRGGWDHEHCTRCSATIEPMTLCWTTRSGDFVLLCDKCHEEVFADRPRA